MRAAPPLLNAQVAAPAPDRRADDLKNAVRRWQQKTAIRTPTPVASDAEDGLILPTNAEGESTSTLLPPLKIFRAKAGGIPKRQVIARVASTDVPLRPPSTSLAVAVKAAAERSGLTPHPASFNGPMSFEEIMRLKNKVKPINDPSQQSTPAAVPDAQPMPVLRPRPLARTSVEPVVKSLSPEETPATTHTQPTGAPQLIALQQSAPVVPLRSAVKAEAPRPALPSRPSSAKGGQPAGLTAARASALIKSKALEALKLKSAVRPHAMVTRPVRPVTRVPVKKAPAAKLPAVQVEQSQTPPSVNKVDAPKSNSSPETTPAQVPESAFELRLSTAVEAKPATEVPNQAAATETKAIQMAEAQPTEALEDRPAAQVDAGPTPEASAGSGSGSMAELSVPTTSEQSSVSTPQVPIAEIEAQADDPMSDEAPTTLEAPAAAAASTVQVPPAASMLQAPTASSVPLPPSASTVHLPAPTSTVQAAPPASTVQAAPPQAVAGTQAGSAQAAVKLPAVESVCVEIVDEKVSVEAEAAEENVQTNAKQTAEEVEGKAIRSKEGVMVASVLASAPSVEKGPWEDLLAQADRLLASLEEKERAAMNESVAKICDPILDCKTWPELERCVACVCLQQVQALARDRPS